ncbi:helix-turn-helix transcriptional regulator [Flammeovirga kamogawensis]|uniref:HTH luxR-type domain-containing protein n=1 Tax=Flammeovirga kamogawensis TaxID=373891 RepID=A0ABX8GWC8_9BACT|nr:hypothetical protein [Flammeovirga kamogawensis]MBB6459688.1 DNA-binding CsgD family transcriptional regulator [Flammeovirga kamogawensis]QWG07250.1 hypothetical protein KM029_18400 [Flammeovirga kamogawensis]TRX69070.1 hypothetical protein EO216_13390 [Flammeovirga kamogawensis]
MPHIYQLGNGDKLEEDSLKILSNEHKIEDLLVKTATQRKNLHFSNAFNYAGETLFLAEEAQDTVLMVKAYQSMGVLYYLFKQDEEAGIYFNKAYQYQQKLSKTQAVSNKSLYATHYYLALYYQRINNYKSLKIHIDSCFTYAKSSNENAIYKVYLNEKLASYYEGDKNYKQSLALLFKGIDRLENLPDSYPNKEIHKSFLIILYGHVAQNYFDLNRQDVSKKYFEKALKVEDKNGEYIFYQSYVMNRYAKLLALNGAYKDAYFYQTESKTINDTYLNLRNDRNKDFLTIRSHYKEEIDKKNEQLAKQQQEISARNKQLLYYKIIFLIIVVALIGGVLFFRWRNERKKHFLKELASKELLALKNKELTTNTLRLIEREEVIELLRVHIENSEIGVGSKRFLKSIDRNSETLWDGFNKTFIDQNIGFYERLEKEVPNLSAADLKVCALIKLNFSGKEMAYLLGISLGSVHVARHRLRKKMNLERDINLTNYINSI